MALKFLNKKGWHTGSLRNIENVWKAEQKHEAEQKKLEELRRQIQEERERNDFRLLQEQAGLVPRQERLEFLYDSGLAVGRSDGGGSGVSFKALEPSSGAAAAASSSASSQQQQPSVPGALFEEKPYSANDSWRKLHSDPLLLIRQREQEALARIKNNPVQMALIRKSVEEKNHKEKAHDKDCRRKHSHRKKHSSRRDSDSDSDYNSAERERKRPGREKSRNERQYHRPKAGSDDEIAREAQSRKSYHKDSKTTVKLSSGVSNPEKLKIDKKHSKSKSHYESSSKAETKDNVARWEREKQSFSEERHKPHYKRRNVVPKLTEEERAAKLREMQVDAELHEEQRWKRLRKAEEDDKQEAARSSSSGGKNFLDAAQKSMYGAEKGGSSTIEESVRRRTYYSQRRVEAGEGNAFRRS